MEERTYKQKDENYIPLGIQVCRGKNNESGPEDDDYDVVVDDDDDTDADIS